MRDTGKLRTKPSFTAGEISDACNGQILKGSPDTVAKGLSTDTRTIDGGEAFLALTGPNHDAHDYIPEAVTQNCSVIIGHRPSAVDTTPDDVCYIKVQDTLDALTKLAAWHRKRLDGMVFAITGSCGKSTVKEIAGAILKEKGYCSVAEKSFNNKIGVSLSLLSANQNDKYIVLELGANHHGEIDQLASIAQPDVSCITCIGECHLEGFGSIEGVKEAKAELIPHTNPQGLLVLNADDPRCCDLKERFAGDVCTFGFSETADFRPVPIKTGQKGQLCRIGDLVFNLALPGKHNLLNAAAAYAMAQRAGASEHDAFTALANVKAPKLRYEKRHVAGIDFILDCYNSNPTAMRAVAGAFGDQETSGSRIMLCGDMLELGESTDTHHVNTGRMLAESKIDILIAVGTHAHKFVEGWKNAGGPARNALAISDVEKAWLFLHRLCQKGDLVMVKGSRKLKLENVVDSFAEYVAGLQQEVA